MSARRSSITHMAQYQHSSFEELRVGDYASDRKKPGSDASDRKKPGSAGFGGQTGSEAQGAGAAGTGKRSEETPLNHNTVTEACQENIIGDLARCSRLLAEPSDSDPLRTPVVELQLLKSLKVKAEAPPLQPLGEATHLSAQSAFMQLRGDPAPGTSWQECKVQFSNFSTFVSKHRCAPDCKAYYEIEILTDFAEAVFGFCNSRMTEPNFRGAGDCNESWALDGFRQFKLHNGEHGWPADRWKPGDVIGLACDLEQRQLWFSINGSFSAPYGPIFSGLSKDDIDKGLHAFISASAGEVRYNLGEQWVARPFKHAPPIADFRPFATVGVSSSKAREIKVSKRSAGRGSARVTSHAKSGQKIIFAAQGSSSAPAAAAPVFSWSSGGGSTSMGQATGAGDAVLFAKFTCVHTCASPCCCNADGRALTGGKRSVQRLPALKLLRACVCQRCQRRQLLPSRRRLLKLRGSELSSMMTRWKLTCEASILQFL